MAYNNNYFGGDTPEVEYYNDPGESRDIQYSQNWPASPWSQGDKQDYMETGQTPTYPWEDEQYQDDYYAGESYDPDNPMNYGSMDEQGYGSGLSEGLGGSIGGMGGAGNQMSGMLKFLGQQGMGAGLGGGLNKGQFPGEIDQMRQEFDEFGTEEEYGNRDRFKFNDPSGETDQLKDMDYYQQRMGMWDKDRMRGYGGYNYSRGEQDVYRNMENEMRRLRGGGLPSNLPEGWEWQENEGRYGLPPYPEPGR